MGSEEARPAGRNEFRELALVALLATLLIVSLL